MLRHSDFCYSICSGRFEGGDTPCHQGIKKLQACQARQACCLSKRQPLFAQIVDSHGKTRYLGKFPRLLT